MADLTGFKVVAPTCVSVGEPFSLKIKALTTPYEVDWANVWKMPRRASGFNCSCRGFNYLDNVPRNWKGQISIQAEDCSGPSEFTFDSRQGVFPNDPRPIAQIEGFKFNRPGTKVITVRDVRSKALGKSNPVIVTADPPKLRVFWGDIHSQTFFTDGLRCPEEIYYFARDEGFLDIFALSDHAEGLTDEQWRYFTDVTNRFNEPNKFATLVGLEWTNMKKGHRNIYYPGDWGPILRSTDPVNESLAKVYEVAREHGALVIPHHSASKTMGVDWSLGHDSEVERLCEIHSVWGNSERPREAGNIKSINVEGGESKKPQHVIDALNMGYRFGLIGGGDIHDGRPGDELHSELKGVNGTSRQGIMGVWAKELTREAIFDALWNRRCFASTNIRPYIEFSVCRQMMGSEVAASSSRPIHVQIASEVPVAKVEIVRNGQDWQVFKPETEEFHWEGEDTITNENAWYYLRMTRSDEEMAWSSPVWVKPE